MPAPKLPAIPPGEAAAYNHKLRDLFLTFRNTVAGLGIDRASILAAYQSSVAKTGLARVQGLSAASSNAEERGTAGGSVDLTNRIDVKAQAALALADALNVKNVGLGTNELMAAQAQQSLATGKFDLAQDLAAEQSDMANSDFANGTIPGGGGGGGAPGGGDSQYTVQDLNRLHSNIDQLFRMYAVVSPHDRQSYLTQIRQLWDRRNSVRKQMGLSAYTADQLQNLLAKYGNQNPNGRGVS
jgi:hypothetical protein